MKTLRSTINALLQNSLGGEEIEGITAELTKKGFIKVNQAKISYGGIGGAE